MSPKFFEAVVGDQARFPLRQPLRHKLRIDSGQAVSIRFALGQSLFYVLDKPFRQAQGHTRDFANPIAELSDSPLRKSPSASPFSEGGGLLCFGELWVKSCIVAQTTRTMQRHDPPPHLEFRQAGMRKSPS